MEVDGEEEGEVVEEPVEVPKAGGGMKEELGEIQDDVKEEPAQVQDDRKEERREGHADVKEEGMLSKQTPSLSPSVVPLTSTESAAPSSALTDLFPSSQLPSTPKLESKAGSAPQSAETDTTKRKEKRRSRWEMDDLPRKREERKEPSHRSQDSKGVTPHKPQDARDPNRPREPIQAKESTQVKWDETVEKAEASRTSGDTRDESRHRSQSRGTAGDAASVRSHSRSSSRHSPPPAASQRKDQSEFTARTGADSWKPTDEGSYSRSRSDHGPSSRPHREDTSHRHDRRGLPYEYSQPSRKGLDYGAAEDRTEPVHREPRSRYDRYDSHHHDRSSNRPHRDDYEQDGGRVYPNLNQTGALGDDEDRPRPPHLSGDMYDRRDRGSQEQRPRRRSPSYGAFGQRPSQQEGQPSRYNGTGWGDAPFGQNDHGSAIDDGTPGWGRPHGSQRHLDREAEPRGDWSSRRHQGWEAPQDRGRHGHGNSYRTNGNHPATSDWPRGQAEEYRHLSPKRERQEVSVKDESNPLKRSGSPLAPLEDRAKGEPVTKRQRVATEEPNDVQATANQPESTWGALPSLPSDAPAPLPDEDIPPAPPSPPHTEDMAGSGNGANVVSTADSPMQIETPDVPPARTPNQPDVEAVAVEPQPVANVAPPRVSITVTPANNVGADAAAGDERTETTAPLSELAPLIPPAWSPVLPPSPVVPASQAGTVWRQTSPMMQSPVMPSGTIQNEDPSRAPTPNPNFAFSLLDLRTPVANGGDPMASDRSTFMRRKGEKLDPADDLKAYNKKFVGIARLDDFIMPTGADRKEATLGKGTFGYVYHSIIDAELLH